MPGQRCSRCASTSATVLRQAMCTDGRERPGLYFGTTGGDVWASGNLGESWRCIARHLPEIYSVSHAA